MKPATMANFLDDCASWASSLRSNKDNIGIFLFSGHGIGVGFDRRVLTLEDFGKFEVAPFQGSVSLDNIYAGLAPNERSPEIARKQFYFIDAGSGEWPIPDHLERNATHIFPVGFTSVRDDREASLFFASAPGGFAYAKADELTLFVRALLSCLNGQGAELSRGQAGYAPNSWVVTSASLTSGLQAKAKADQEGTGLPVSFVTNGSIGSAVLHECPTAPIVPVSVRSEDAPKEFHLEIVSLEGDDDHVPIPQYYDGSTSPKFTIDLPAGMYRFRVRIAGREKFRSSQFVFVQPPEIIFPI
ncbi:hypothetical protein [Bradyrhizobium sp. CB3481]|uniref:hypothetical protein n=1 Tax=Bradyrhizobium sp. CB3481 TaxID=3039158 RepID=UPI0024B05EA9|nr:hypothetical protein [Bradyrhizobium sp. CB3481]WFU19937.1 hypothetical protein QA643_17200 [Bradyrhizobium sp. CB3481]